MRLRPRSSIWLYPLWLTTATTGARRGELLGLQWSDVDLDGRQLAIRRARVAVGYEVIESTPKSGKARTIALDPQTVAVLKDWRQAQRMERMAFGEGRVDGTYVFTREEGAPLHPHAVADSFRRVSAPRQGPDGPVPRLEARLGHDGTRQRRQPQGG
jgi:integrase